MSEPLPFFRRSIPRLLLSPAFTRACLGPVMMWPRFRRRVKGAPRRVLVVRLDQIGDLVLTTPMLRELRAALPEAWITLVVKSGPYSLMRTCPYVNEVLEYKHATVDGGGRADLRNRRRAMRFAVKQLWPRRFDLAINPRQGIDADHASFLCYFSGASRRIGFTERASVEKSIQNRGLDRLFTEVLPALDAHEVENNLSVVRHLQGKVSSNRLELWPEKEDECWAEKNLAGVAGQPLVAMCLGAGVERKAWPVERFAEVATSLVCRKGIRIILVGGPADSVAAEQLERLVPPGHVVNLAGRATLPQTLTVLRRCCLYVGNDTGPMHLAAAVGVPVVEICTFARSLHPWHANSPARFGPWGVPAVILQPERPIPPCEDACVAMEPHCILDVAVDAVVHAAEQMLAANRKCG